MKHLRSRLVALVSTAVSALACGTSPDSTTSVGAGADGSGGDDASDPTLIVCPTGHEVMVVPAVLVSGLCLATDAPVKLPVCVGETGDSVSQCQERLADGAQFWFTPPREIAPAEGFADCGIGMPPSCEFEQCPLSDGILPKYPRSLCAAEETAEAFDCGGAMSVYDENCCVRLFCDDMTCAEGFTCRTAQYMSREAWLLTNGEQTVECAVREDTEPGPTSIDVCFAD